MKNKSILFGITVSLMLIIPIWVVDYFVYNSIMNTIIPVSLIFGTVVALRHTESVTWYRRLLALAIIGGAIYFVIPTYTISEAEVAIHQSLQEDVTLFQLDNTPMERDGFDPLSPKLFYTFRVIESKGSEYILMFNPDSGESFKKSG
ncbi:hypothetical protein ACFPYN_13390 [Paenisporosarcina macmurdoensis]|uniref:Uncharacterized protein n=1 Tax=Paenisporosarcina macmurdoensis TaxID=212659 RepID=A0ABW1L8W2_9BACL